MLYNDEYKQRWNEKYHWYEEQNKRRLVKTVAKMGP